jgi:ATP/maltotriose-dependent transcriptional regulator MalT
MTHTASEEAMLDLLLESCSNEEIAAKLHMRKRTIKDHFRKLYLKHGIVGGIKRVKLATTIYRQREQENKE